MNASILIVDDEVGIRDMLEWELSNHGHEIVAAADGAQAIEQLGSREFDLVLSDIRMPRASGLDVLRAAKTFSPETEVIVATGYAELSYAVDCVRGGAFDFVQKPFSDLVRTIDRALERRQQQTASSLSETSRVIFSNPDPQRLPQLIVKTTMTVMHADDVSLMLLDAESKLYIAHSHGLCPEIARRERIKLGERVAGRVAAQRKPVLLTNRLEEDPRFPNVTTSTRVKSSIVYPLVSGEELVGVLNINRTTNPVPFRKQDLDRAGMLSSQVLLALENARLGRKLVTSERMASMGQLAAGVAHEITNPLAYILGMQSLLCDQLAPLQELGELFDRNVDVDTLKRAWQGAGGRASIEDVAQAIREVGSVAGRIQNLVRDMRGLARHDDHASSIVDLNDAIRAAIRISSPQTKRRARIQANLEDGLWVSGHTGRFSQIFINLLVNAAQAIGASGRSDGSIVVTSERLGALAIVRVCDDGPGIDEKNLSRIFDRFFTTKSAETGTGLGLAISRDILQAYGGAIAVDSPPGQGATFTITLPAADCDAPLATDFETTQPFAR
jgi:signal transduction histidine kinase/CheY-like chemotaxis protein